MGVLCSLSRARLSNDDNNLMFIKLWCGLAIHALGSSSDLGHGFHCPLTDKGNCRTHRFIEFLHLCEYWQLFSSFENLMILRRMWPTSERIFVTLLQRRNEIWKAVGNL
jgi:hypothetical protein